MNGHLKVALHSKLEHRHSTHAAEELHFVSGLCWQSWRWKDVSKMCTAVEKESLMIAKDMELKKSHSFHLELLKSVIQEL